jgi:hypothetical protein
MDGATAAAVERHHNELLFFGEGEEKEATGYVDEFKIK